MRRNAGLAALVGGLASAVAIAYLARASEHRRRRSTGRWPACWALLGIGYLAALVDARTPLLVADTQGVRIRLGRDWRGLPWGALAPGRAHARAAGCCATAGWSMVVHNPARLIEELDRGGRRQSRLSQRLYGAPFAVPLGLSTRVTGAGDDLTAALAALAGRHQPGRRGRARAATTPSRSTSRGRRAPRSSAEPEPEAADEAAPRRAALRATRRPRRSPTRIGRVCRARFQRERDDEAPTTVERRRRRRVAEPSRRQRHPEPAARARHRPSRAEVRREVADDEDDEPERPRAAPPRQRQPGRGHRRSGASGSRRSPAPGTPVEPLLIDELAVEPAEDPVIGPELAAARTRLGLTVDQLAERTRIRPHVIESIEVDDFAPCGGDFYARGHLRTLARVLGIDVAPLLTAYDERYADAPINPRRVFEAELATGAHGSIRGTRGGPNWSVLVAAVMALVLAWSVARLVMDSPVDLRGAAPVLNGSAGVGNGGGKAAPAVPVRADRGRRRRPGRRPRRHRQRSSSTATSPSARPRRSRCRRRCGCSPRTAR